MNWNVALFGQLLAEGLQAVTDVLVLGHGVTAHNKFAQVLQGLYDLRVIFCTDGRPAPEVGMKYYPGKEVPHAAAY